MVKTKGNEKETVTAANLRFTNEEIARLDKDGNWKCLRCGWTHTTTECAELRLAHANRELEKINRFVYTGSVVEAIKGETPVDTLLRGYRKLLHSDHTEAAEMMKEE